MKKTAVILVVVAVVAIVGWNYLAGQQGIPVEAAPAAVGEIREFVDERGKTRLPQVYSVTMPYTGRIEPITVIEGDPVYEGQPVAHLVAKDLEINMDAAQAAVDRIEEQIEENADASVEMTGLKQALNYVKSMESSVEAAQERVKAGEAKLKYAQQYLQRVRSAQGAYSKDELERAELQTIEAEVDYRQDQLILSAMEAMQAATALMPTAIQQYINRKDLSGDVLEKQKAEAVARLKQAELEQVRGTIPSPVNGSVLERHVSDEQQVQAGTVLLTIGNLDDLEVEADILSQEVVNIKEGDEVEIYGPAIGEPAAQGKVTRIFPAGFVKVSSLGVEQQRVKVVVDFRPEDLERLRSQRHLGVDYRVRVRIFTAADDNALRVPRSALFRGADGGWQVFVVRGGVARLQPVDVGLMNDELVQLTDGVEPGELVILAPETNLTDGVAVSPIIRDRAPLAEPVSGD